MLTITWEYLLSVSPKYFHLQIYDEINRHILLQRLIDGKQRSIEIDIKDYLKEYSSIYMICLNIPHNKYCRNVQLQQVKSSSLVISTNKHENYQSSQYFYLLSGILLGAIFVCAMLIIVCCWRVRHLSREKLSNSIEKSPTNTLYHPPPHSSIFYRPLNIISYPPKQQQQQQQQQSCDTSECSIHSSTDTSQLANDCYHIYQQIPPVYNCQIHPIRTHALV
ncbi:unnamed protein product [Rotaria magnacalcarata]|nr:unnamed protein product [Rotaria magnacalcarata]